MAFDDATRGRLQRFVSTARALLTEEFARQLQHDYGLDPSTGDVAGLDTLAHLDDRRLETARILREIMDHYLAAEMATGREGRQDVLDRIVREQAFTILNRLAALRMMEARGILIGSVEKGYQSQGFQLYQRVANGSLGETGEAYRCFLFSVFDTFAADLPALFDRHAPQGRLFPRDAALLAVLKEFDAPDLEPLWAEDETIGWIYQYFNPKEERQAMRRASQAPRNGRELAVRNQFFTPRYVVEFLVDNTLGRIWYEMHKGITILGDECRYLVRRPNEVFLAPSEAAPADRVNETDLSQEELLRKPGHIGHRPKKDPRDLRVLDPACGSGHFLLYAFDLLERIYEEAWKDLQSPKSEATGRTLHDDFETLDDLRRAAPKLIIEHNLHGIDIDARAVQIAALALWLRAQKAWATLGLKAVERPRIDRSNIATAEPMPGEEDLRREFIGGLTPRVLGQLVVVVFEKMKLAGEAGSLLKIEEEIKDAVVEARKQWLEGPKPERQLLFPGMSDARPKQHELRFDLDGVTDERFWEQAEDRILDALKDYSERAENGLAVRRRLFADDAARGFAFIDLCCKRYDVVLMNPPFGLSPKSVFGYFKGAYPDTYVDLYACSVTRGRALAPLGAVGAITSRAFLTTKKLVRWRTNEVVEHIQLLLDLGLGVMDDAFVEACAFVLSEKISSTFVAFNKRNATEKSGLPGDLKTSDSYIVDRKNIKSLPSAKILYSVSPRIHALLRNKKVFEPDIGTAREGLRTFDDFRFLRLRWEVPPICIGLNRTWETLAKGGEFARYYSDLSLLVRWAADGRELAEQNRKINGQIAQSRQASDYYRRAGCTYSKRSAKGFSVRALPSECIIGTKGPAVLSDGTIPPAYILGWLNSRLIRSLVHIQANAYEFNTGILKRLPWISPEWPKKLADDVIDAILALRREASLNETNSCFSSLTLATSITELSTRTTSLSAEVVKVAAQCQSVCDETMDRLYVVDSTTLEAVSVENADDAGGEEDQEDSDESPELAGSAARVGKQKAAFELISYSIGVCIGRWDVRMASDPTLTPKLPDPFDHLPVCPPGMLVGPDGLPAEPGRIVSEGWLRARADANTLPPEGSVKNPSVADDGYPLRISWDSILADDPSFNRGQLNRDDIVRRVREVLDLLWEDRAHEIEQEACNILGVSDLRDYFRRPTGFFQDHLKGYSKNRRKAPIYWPLSTTSGVYTVWLHYHRLTDQTLYTAANDFVGPKIEETSQLAAALRTSNARTREEERELEHLQDLEAELKELQDELLRIAPTWKPNHDDGVQITAAPLWRLFRYRPWQTALNETWEKLEKGDYDWAHLALSYWPDRVRKKCRSDKSLAIAHGLEDLYEPPPEKPGAGRRGRKSGAEA